MVPFIPIENANVAIIDARASDIIVNNLEKLNIKIIRTVKCDDLQESISCHPDIIMHPINYNTIIVAPNLYDYYENELTRHGINVIKGETILGSKYPNDIAYNVGRLKDIAIHNFKYTDEKLKYYLKKEGIKFLNINQGYSKCSLLIVDNISGITADVYMQKKLTELGYDILLVKPGHIKLFNEKYGFIGGTSGNLNKDTILLTGKIDNHPSSCEIEKFIMEKNKNILYLSNDDLIDLGTIITLNGIC
ncbi:DUF6873 family GME fold protein [Tissierella sp. Yu-01]|uniref:DUF6873 family GME fold protein n=1 Tax=Tissierella sp. Yu-01 TaxID=3035694 RepID=UPI00240D8547|nr:hypothetical protein [Tissierella sp. Yu-01]WFA09890.1 hypothetical protein P3962_04885 [Tissierella sp. Yu-01]